MKDLDFIDDLLDDEDQEILKERINKVKTDVLMEEPCPLYEDD
jgi:hypothetical protein